MEFDYEQIQLEIYDRIVETARDTALSDLEELGLSEFAEDAELTDKALADLSALSFHLGVPSEELAEHFLDTYRGTTLS